MAACRRAGAMPAAGSNLASAASIRAWMSPIQAANPGSGAVTGVGFQGELLQHLAFEHLDLALRGVQALLAEARQLQPALVRLQRLLEGQFAALHLRHELLQLGERALERGLGTGLGHAVKCARQPLPRSNPPWSRMRAIFSASGTPCPLL